MCVLKEDGEAVSHRLLVFIHYFLTIAILIITISSAFIVPSPANARPLYAKDLPSSLKNYCQVCHSQASGGPLNKFGKDYQSFNFNISAISTLDSDGDGFTNGEELIAGTFPGDSDSYPGAPEKMLTIKLMLIVTGSLLLFALLWVFRSKIKKRSIR